MVPGWVPGIAPSQPPSPPTTPGTPPPYPLVAMSGYTVTAGSWRTKNMVVGLYSVDQLSLCVHFSGLRVLTEGYNLLRIDNR